VLAVAAEAQLPQSCSDALDKWLEALIKQEQAEIERLTPEQRQERMREETLWALRPVICEANIGGCWVAAPCRSSE
jgi:hypothetical protein